MRAEDDELTLNGDEHELVAKLRALPPEGEEPDWQKLEASIRAEVGDRAPTVWWRNWKWIVPIWALAATAAIALIVLRGHHDETPVQQLTTTTHQEEHHVTPAPEQTHSTTTAPSMWLGGEAVDIDDLDEQSLDDLDQSARDAMGSDDVSLEDLDDAGLDQLEDWLEKNKS
jgi:hypothetical protein